MVAAWMTLAVEPGKIIKKVELSQATFWKQTFKPHQINFDKSLHLPTAQ